MKTCNVPGCERDSATKGMCNPHYRRNATHGSPLGGAGMATVEERFWAKVERTGGCWAWTGSKCPKGYGKLRAGGRAGGRKLDAHRVSYEIAKGPIPDGLFIDHACRNTGCVNPNHLRAVTNKQNQENRDSATSSKTGVRGVYPSGSKFQAVVGHNRELHYVGRYSTLEEAEAAVIAKRNELYTHNLADRISA